MSNFRSQGLVTDRQTSHQTAIWRRRVSSVTAVRLQQWAWQYKFWMEAVVCDADQRVVNESSWKSGVNLYIFHVNNMMKKLVKQQYLLHMSHNMANFGPLTAEIGSGVWRTPANFNGFRVLPSLLQRRRSPETNQTVHDIWPSPGLVHTIGPIYIFGGSCPV